MAFGVGLFYGFGLSIEHIEDEEDGVAWGIILNVACLRFFVVKLLPE